MSVTSVYHMQLGNLLFAFRVFYDNEGNLIKIVNAYDNAIIYPEGQATEGEGNVKGVDAGSS